MSEIKDGGSAFPGKVRVIAARGDGWSTGHEENAPGMSLRDYFAGQAISGWVSDDDPTVFAHQAYRLADAMLKARETR